MSGAGVVASGEEVQGQVLDGLLEVCLLCIDQHPYTTTLSTLKKKKACRNA